MTSFRVIIAGGRDFNDFDLLCRSCDKILKNKTDIVIVSGKAKGADSLGEKYAELRGHKIAYFPANWEANGRGAGFIRNKQMAENADALIAFWDCKSKGTANMIEQAQKHGLKIRIVGYNGDIVIQENGGFKYAKST